MPISSAQRICSSSIWQREKTTGKSYPTQKPKTYNMLNFAVPAAILAHDLICNTTRLHRSAFSGSRYHKVGSMRRSCRFDLTLV